MPELAKESAALLAHFGVSDEALLDVLTGTYAPTGKLPFELPSSMLAVRAQKEDVPHDSKDPLFPSVTGSRSRLPLHASRWRRALRVGYFTGHAAWWPPAARRFSTNL